MTDDHNEHLIPTVMIEEIESVLHDMLPDKAPDPDGFPSFPIIFGLLLNQRLLLPLNIFFLMDLCQFEA